MSPKPTFDIVKDILVRKFEFPANEVKPEAHLINDLGADDLMSVEILLACEEEIRHACSGRGRQDVPGHDSRDGRLS